MRFRGWFVLVLFLFCLTLFAGQDQTQQFQQEKTEVTASPAAKLFPANVFKKIDSLQAQSKQSKDTDKAKLLLQQARWLLPETKSNLPEHISRVMGTLKFKHDQFPTSVVYAPDALSLFTASRDGTVRQWNLQNGRTIKSWDFGQPLSSLSLSNNGQYLAVAEGYRPSPNLDLGIIALQDEYAIHVIDLASSAIKWKLKGTKVPIYCLAFSADGQFLASGGQAEKSEAIRIWNLATGKLDRAFKPLQAIVNLTWSKDASKLYVTTSDRTFGVFDAKSGLQMQSIRERGMIFAMALSPDERTLAIAGDTIDDAGTKSIKLYNTQDWKVMQTLSGHQDSVVALAFHPKGNLLVSASAKGSEQPAIKVWDLIKKTAITQYLGHTNDVLAVALPPTGDSVASVSLDGSIRLWQTSQVKPGRKLLSCKAPIWTVASQGNRILTVSADQSAVLWDAESGQELRRYSEHKSPVTAGAFRPDGNEVATGGGDTIIRLWDPATGKTNLTLPGHTGVITAMAYSPDGKRLYSASADKTVRIWNIAEKKAMYTMQQHRSVVTSLAVNLDGSLLASGGADNIIRIWKTSDGSEVRSLIGHTGAITGLAFSPGGTLLASVGADGITRIWDPSTNSAALHTFSGHVGQLMAVAFSPNLKYLATAGADETIRIWNLLNYSEARALKGHTDWITSLAYLSDGESLVSSSVDGTVLLWSETKAFEPVVYGHEQPIRYLAISPQGDRLASGSEEGKIILWDTATGNDLATLNSHQHPIKALNFSNDGKRLVSADRDTIIKLWNVPEGKETQSLKCNSDGINRIAFLNQDRGIAASTGSSNISLWVFDGRQLKTEPALSFLGYERHCNSVAFAQDHVALGGTDGIVKFWKLNQFKQDSDEQLRAYNVAVNELTLSADGKTVLTSNQENEFKLWNIDDKKQINSWKARPAKLSALALHAKGELVLAGFETGEVVLWDTKTGKELRSWKFRSMINDLILSPTTKHAYVGTSNGVIYQLDLP